MRHAPWVAMVLLVVALPTNADDFSFFAGGGIDQHDKPPNGLWQREDNGFALDADMRDLYFRFGVESHGVRLAYFDLGRTRMDAKAPLNEGCADHWGSHAVAHCSDRIARVVTTGSARGFSLGSMLETHGFFLEAALTYVRRSFSAEATGGNDGTGPLHQIFSGVLHGFGGMAGVGYREDDLSFGLWVYNDNIGGRFAESSQPSGADTVIVAAVEFEF